MSIEETIKKYGITIIVLNGEKMLNCARIPKNEHQTACAFIKSHKPEIIAYIEAEEAEEKRKLEERKAKIKAIAGLDEIKAARIDLAKWRVEFEASFSECGGLGVRQKPQYDFDDMYKKYPIAAAYLKAEAEAEKSNVELSAIGTRALEAIIETPEDYASVIEKMEAEKEAFRKKHFWD